MKVFYLGVDVSKKKLDLCLRSNGKDILYDVIPNDLSSIKSDLLVKTGAETPQKQENATL